MVNKIIYIAGYGRSGSTLLARILGSHENIFTVGELINFLNLVNIDDSICSCGIRDPKLLVLVRYYSKI